MATRVALPDSIARARWMLSHFEDFFYYVDGDLFTALAADAGASVTEDADGVGGILQLVTGAVNNNEAGVATSNELFQYSANLAFMIGCRLQYTEANTDDANVAFGFADAFGANLLGDNGASYSIGTSGALIYKIDGGTVWRAVSENNGTATDTVSTTTAGGASYQWLEIEGVEVDGSNFEITFFVDGQPLRDSNNKAVKHTLALASSTQMDLGAYVKAGDVNSETLNVDCMYWAVRRL